MKIKIITTIGLLTAMLGACTTDEDPAGKPQGAANAIVLDVSVATPRTRAQQTGTMTFTTLKSTGFGVYGYEGTYNRESSLPTLFKVGEGVGANTKVSFEEGGTDPTTLLTIPGSWQYPDSLKEWQEEQKYTFFAYAPYVAAADVVATGSGINSVKTDDTAGDPTIGYTVAEDPAQSVDLLWGVRSDTGKPWTNITQGETASAVLITFYHALCAVGLHAQVMVNQKNELTDFDDQSSLGTIGDKDGCKVTLKSITITPAGTPEIPADGEKPAVPAVPAVKFHKSGVLNLNNNTAHQPQWGSYSAVENDIASLVLNSSATIDSKLLDPKPNDFGSLNPSNYDVMEKEAYTDKTKSTWVPGITESANSQTIIAGDNLFMLIPQAAQDYTITVEYFLTYKTASGYHREAHTGTATIKDLTLAAGVKYYLNLVFGLTTFRLTVNATDWEETTTPVTIATELGTTASHSLAPRRR